MKAVFITAAGGPEVLQMQETEKPTPKQKEVLIKVQAAGVNRSDIFTRKNPHAYGANMATAKIPGLEVAGTIEAVGGDVKRFTVSSGVCALVAGGGYAEYICVDETLCLPAPANLDLIEAASLPEAIFTVWFNVFQQAKIQAGEKLLIHGGSSGVGVMGLQMANALSIETYATAGSDDKIDFLNKLGVKHTLNYKTQDFAEAFKDEKIDVILDMVGGDYTAKNIKILNHKGRLVNINAMKEREVTINIMDIMTKNITLTGSMLKPQPVAVKALIAKEVEATIWPLIEQKKIRPIIYETFKLQDAAGAHKLMESSSHIGKIILTMG